MQRIFLGIGAQKAGTSWLHRCLAAHPDIWMPPVKEIHFFNERARHGGGPLPPRLFTSRVRVELREFGAHLLRKRDIGVLPWGWRYFLARRDIDWYRRVLAHGGARLTGDITPAYSTLSDAAVRELASDLPDVRAVLLLRNPIDRAFSHAVMDLSRLAPRDVLALPAERFYEHFRSPDSVKRTAYSAIIDRWQAVIGPDRLLVAFYEELTESPTRLLDRVTELIGATKVDWSAQAPVDTRVNAGQGAKIPPAYRDFLMSMYEGEIAGAVESLERATALAPEDARAWSVLAQALEASGRSAEAEAARSKAEALRPK